MQEAHNDLLEEITSDEPPRHEGARARAFIRRSVATGAVLNAREDRAAAQGLINFWTARLSNLEERSDDSSASPQPVLEFAHTVLARFEQETLRQAVKEADRWLKLLSEEDQKLARRLMLRLARLAADGKGYEPIPVSRAVLHDMPPSPQTVDKLIDGLNAAGVIRVAKRGAPNADMVELKARSLLESWPTYRGWLDERRRFRENAQRTVNDLQLAERAAKYLQGDKSALLDEKETKNAEELRESDYVRDPALLTLEIAQLIDRSRLHWVNEDKRRLRRQRRWLIGLVVGLIGLVIGLAVVSWIAIHLANVAKLQAARATAEKEKAETAEMAAEQARDEATSLRLAVQAMSYQRQQPELSALLSLEAYRTKKTVATRSSLLSVVQPNPPLLTFLRAHNGPLTSVAFSPNGKELASSDNAGQVLLWEFATNRLVGPLLEGHEGGVTGLAFSFDGKLLASGGDDGTVHLWDAATHTAVGGLPPDKHRGLLRSMAFHPKRNVLAFSDTNGNLFLWEITRQPPLGPPFAELKALVTSVAFSPDGKLLAAGLERQTVRLWDIDTGKPFDPPLTRPTSRLQHAADLKETLPWLWPADPPHDNFVTAVAFSPNGKLLAAGSSDGTVLVWDVARREPSGELLDTRAKYVTGVAFSPDGNFLVAGSIDGAICLWDVASGQSLSESRTGSQAVVTSVAFSPDTKTLATGGWRPIGKDSTVALRDLTAHMPLRPNIDQKNVSSSALSRDGKTVASGSATGTILIWDLDGQKPRGPVINGHKGKVTSVAFSPEGKLLASVGKDHTVRFWDVETCKSCGQPFDAPVADVAWLAFSLDGKTLAAGSTDGTLLVWSVTGQTASGVPVRCRGDFGNLTSMAISSDGKLLAAATDDRIIRFWDVTSSQVLEPFLYGHRENVRSLAFSSNGALLASGSDDRDARLWKVATRQPAGLPMSDHTGPVTAVAFNHDGTLLASGSSDRTLRLWDVASRRRLGSPLVGHKDQVSGLVFSSTGRVLLSGSADGAILYWKVGVESWKARARRLAGRNFEWGEWQEFMLGEPYHKTCPSAPIPFSVVDGVGLDVQDRAATALAAGALEKASEAYTQAVEWALNMDDAVVCNNLCWQGSINGFAREVLPAGERAVLLEPDSVMIRDTRGLARALAGDRTGAIQDFTFYVEHYEGDASLREQRRRWIQELEAGQNPFTAETLAALREQ
jgi:WD40 repeat protein